MKLFKIADQYCKESTWKTLALVKFCLFSMGLMSGMKIPEEKKKMFYALSGSIFIITYIPLMALFHLLPLWQLYILPC